MQHIRAARSSTLRAADNRSWTLHLEPEPLELQLSQRAAVAQLVDLRVDEEHHTHRSIRHLPLRSGVAPQLDPHRTISGNVAWCNKYQIVLSKKCSSFPALG